VRPIDAALKNAAPGTVVNAVPVAGSTGCFEIDVDGTLMHSKLAGQGFPDADKVQAIINAVKAEK